MRSSSLGERLEAWKALESALERLLVIETHPDVYQRASGLATSLRDARNEAQNAINELQLDLKNWRPG